MDEEIQNLDPEFVGMLDLARRLSGVTFYFEKRDLNKPDEVDLKCDDDHARYHTIKSLMEAGIIKIGISSSLIHVEFGRDPSNKMWVIPEP